MERVIWHRRDLRTRDNSALTEAGGDAVPVFVFDPEWLENELVSDSRIKFVLESLKDLNRQYLEVGSHLAVLHGDPVQKLGDLKEEGYEVLFNKDANHFRQEMEREARMKFRGLENSAVDTSGRGNSEEWDRKAQRWFDSEPLSPPENLSRNPLESEVSLDEIRDKHDVTPEKDDFGEGGTKEARRRLKGFLRRIEEYSGCVSSPSKAEASTSHLSPYIRYGCISPREVYQEAERKKYEVENTRSVQMFMDRIFWQQHFNQKIEDNPKLFEDAVNPVYRDLHRDDYDEDKFKAWKRGRTGYPLVDASIRALVETGWLNFRMRAMCASFLSYILKQWWKTGADFFYRHLIDADVAINYYQWQMQSGLIGVHANRIYDPVKQVEENDPDGQFIRKYVPELRPVPDNYIGNPWRMPEKVQERCGVKIGRNYPEPIVDFEREARKAREFFKRKAPEAYAAFKEDEVWKNASLSSRHDREEILEKAGKPQSDLKRFR